jgi:hypothetical protein
MYDSKVSLYTFSSSRGNTPWVSQKDPKTGTIINDTHAYRQETIIHIDQSHSSIYGKAYNVMDDEQ